MSDPSQTARTIRLYAMDIQQALQMLQLYDVPIPAEVSAWVRELLERHAAPTARGGHDAPG